jgi:hypothetical protein
VWAAVWNQGTGELAPWCISSQADCLKSLRDFILLNANVARSLGSHFLSTLPLNVMLHVSMHCFMASHVQFGHLVCPFYHLKSMDVILIFSPIGVKSFEHLTGNLARQLRFLFWWWLRSGLLNLISDKAAIIPMGLTLLRCTS